MQNPYQISDVEGVTHLCQFLFPHYIEWSCVGLNSSSPAIVVEIHHFCTSPLNQIFLFVVCLK
jgi:hypothetical protein